MTFIDKDGNAVCELDANAKEIQRRYMLYSTTCFSENVTAKASLQNNSLIIYKRLFGKLLFNVKIPAYSPLPSLSDRRSYAGIFISFYVSLFSSALPPSLSEASSLSLSETSSPSPRTKASKLLSEDVKTGE